MADKYIDISHNSDPSSVAAPKQVTAAITAISKAASAVVTAANDFSADDLVAFAGVGGMTEINGLVGTVSSPSATQFTVNINSSGFTDYTSGGTATKLQGTTGEIRVLYKDTVSQDQVVDAVQRAKEKLTETFSAS